MILRIVCALLLAVTVCLAADKAVTDNAINDNVRIKLAGDPEVKGGALEVSVAQGVVTISGLVDTQRQKDKATKLAKKVKGVKQVVNNINIKEKNTGK